MVVARQNVTLAEDINEMMDDFRDNHTKVLGVVLNGVMTFQSIADSPVGDQINLLDFTLLFIPRFFSHLIHVCYTSLLFVYFP